MRPAYAGRKTNIHRAGRLGSREQDQRDGTQGSDPDHRDEGADRPANGGAIRRDGITDRAQRGGITETEPNRQDHRDRAQRGGIRESITLTGGITEMDHGKVGPGAHRRGGPGGSGGPDFDLFFLLVIQPTLQVILR